MGEVLRDVLEVRRALFAICPILLLWKTKICNCFNTYSNAHCFNWNSRMPSTIEAAQILSLPCQDIVVVGLRLAMLGVNSRGGIQICMATYPQS